MHYCPVISITHHCSRNWRMTFFHDQRIVSIFCHRHGVSLYSIHTSLNKMFILVPHSHNFNFPLVLSLSLSLSHPLHSISLWTTKTHNTQHHLLLTTFSASIVGAVSDMCCWRFTLFCIAIKRTVIREVTQNESILP